MLRRLPLLSVVPVLGLLLGLATPAWPQAATKPAAPDAAAPAPLVTYKKGAAPIILSAPHGGRTAVPNTPIRRGPGVLQFVTVRDENTAELTEKLADAIEKKLGARPYVVIARFERKYADANRPADQAYEHPNVKPHYDAYHDALKSAIEEVSKRWGRGVLLDIHGQAVRPEAIYRGTRDGKSTTDLLERAGEAALIGPRSIMGHLTAAGYVVLPEIPKEGIGKEVRFNGGYITDAYGSHRGTAIDTMQMEFGGALRKKDRVDKTATDVAAAIAAFAEAYLPKKERREAE